MNIKKIIISSFFSFSLLLANSVLANPAVEEGINEKNMISLQKPPASIKNWYKPSNKRQVWLHTMFRLRRELLAINEYSQLQQNKYLNKWFLSFKKDYQQIGEMVKPWQKFLDLELIKQLELAVNSQKYNDIPVIIRKLENSCDNCHSDFQAITRLMYRSADFNKIKVATEDVNHKVVYSKAMDNLSKTVNRLKIALHDKFYNTAENFIKPLQLQLKRLSSGCGDCHKYPANEQPKQQQDYIFKNSDSMLADLKAALQQKDNKKARMSLGTFAVKICARCHAMHRTTADLKELLE
ncbi:MAG: hypothetical protein QM479_02205 [Pseudomonadota bacterium]